MQTLRSVLVLLSAFFFTSECPRAADPETSHQEQREDARTVESDREDQISEDFEAAPSADDHDTDHETLSGEDEETKGIDLSTGKADAVTQTHHDQFITHHEKSKQTLTKLVDHLRTQNQELTQDHHDALSHLVEKAYNRNILVEEKDDEPVTGDDLKEHSDPLGTAVAQEILENDEDIPQNLLKDVSTSHEDLHNHIHMSRSPIDHSPALETNKATPKLTTTDLEAGKKILKESVEALNIYEKAWATGEPKLENKPDVKHALAKLGVLQKERLEQLEKMQEGTEISAEIAAQLHAADAVNAFISVLPTTRGAPGTQTGLTQKIVETLKAFSRWVDDHTPPAPKDTPEKPSAPKDTLADRANHVKDKLKENHGKMEQHVKTLDTHVQKLKEALVTQNKTPNPDHAQAVACIEEAQQTRKDLLAQALAASRPLDGEETKQLKDVTSGLHHAIGLLPTESPEQQALKTNFMETQSALESSIDTQMHLHTADGIQPTLGLGGFST